MVQLMTRAIGYLWLTSIVGYLVGFHFAIGSFALGTVVARCVNDWLTARAAGRAAADGARTETELVGGSAKLGGRAAEGGPAPPSDLDPDPERAGGDGLERRDASVRLFIFAVSVAANACLFTLFALLYAFQVGDSVWSQPRTWLAVILGPPGALLRWQLARLNGGAVLRRGRWAAFPLGTFIANVAAAAVDTALGGVLVSRGSSMSSRAYDGVIAVLAGAMGSLSTTSTFVGEVAGLLRRRGMEDVGVLYAVSTILVALVVGVATYGWAEWTTGSDIIL